MGRLVGLMLFCVGFGMVMGMFIAETAVVVILSAAFLMCGYHLFCR